MHALILAGGRDTRLHPLTHSTPKAMAPLLGKPVIEHTIDLLKRHGFERIIIAASTDAEFFINYFGSGEKWGVQISYFLEETPLGTAGGLRRLRPILDETFLVIPGDAVTDFDLTSALQSHRKNSTIATLITYRNSDGGTVDSAEDGRVLRFTKHPELRTEQLHTGIYILEPEIISYIPYDTHCDFSSNVIPMLMHNREDLFAFSPEGYWCDMDSLAGYRNVHFDALTGRIGLKLNADLVADGIWIGSDADIHPTVRLAAPVYIGSRSVVGRGTALGRFAAVAESSIIGEKTRITHSIIGSESRVGKEANVYGSILGSGLSLSDSRHLADEIMINGESDIPIRAEISSEFMSKRVAESPALSWSGVEITGVLERSSRGCRAAA